MWALVGVLLLLSAAPPPEDALKITMEGTAPGVGKPARNAAILNAEQEIVLQTIETFLCPNALPLLKPVLEKAPSYIQQSPTLMKCDEEQGNTRVLIEAIVKEEDLKRDIAQRLLPGLVPPRKVLVLIARQDGQNSPVSLEKAGAAEANIADVLRNAGLEIIDSALTRSLYAEPELIQRMQGDSETMGKLARENLADVAVLGLADTSRDTLALSSANVQPNRADMSVRIVRASDGRLLDTLGAEAVVNSLQEAEGKAQALEDAALKVSEQVLVPVALAAACASPSNDVIITIERPTGETMVTAFVESLKAGGIEDAELLIRCDVLARIRVAYSGRIVDLVDRITAGNYAGARLEAKRVVQRDITLDIVSRH